VAVLSLPNVTTTSVVSAKLGIRLLAEAMLIVNSSASRPFLIAMFTSSEVVSSVLKARCYPLIVLS